MDPARYVVLNNMRLVSRAALADASPARPLCGGRTYLNAGPVDEAGAEALSLHVERGAAIVGLEPTCLFTLRDKFLAMGLGERAQWQCGSTGAESNCCVMAGSFGYNVAHQDVSVRMAELSRLPAKRAAAPDTLIVADGKFGGEIQFQQVGLLEMHVRYSMPFGQFSSNGQRCGGHVDPEKPAFRKGFCKSRESVRSSTSGIEYRCSCEER